MADHVLTLTDILDTTGPPSPTEIRERLLDPQTGGAERRRLVLEAETLHYTEEEATAMAPLLRQYIDEHRDTNQKTEQVAVHAAIRLFIAIAPADDAFDYAASMLKPGGSSPLSIELELVLAKMVVRKLTALPPTKKDGLPDLAGRLADLCETYVNPRLLARPKHGALAVNAVLGVVLTRDRSSVAVVQRVQQLGESWFRELVGRRASRLKADLENRGLGHTAPDLILSLDELGAAAYSTGSA